MMILAHKFEHHKNKLFTIFTSYFNENQSFVVRIPEEIAISYNNLFALNSVKYKGPSCYSFYNEITQLYQKITKHLKIYLRSHRK